MKDVTCRYFASPVGKFMYREVDCIGSSPCRGFCVEKKTILGLDIKEKYEIKVIASKGYGYKVYKDYPEYIE